MIENRGMGLRIKYYRNKKGLTQKQLANKIGFGDSAIRNYELGNRLPDPHTLSKIAEVLEVDFYTLNPADTTNTRSVEHILFDIESSYGLIPERIGDQIYLHFDEEARYEYVDRNDEFVKELNIFMDYWLNAFESLAAGEITEEQYADWKDGYPDYSGFDQSGRPVSISEINKLTAEELEEQKKQIEMRYEIYVSAKNWAGETDIMDFETFKNTNSK